MPGRYQGGRGELLEEGGKPVAAPAGAVQSANGLWYANGQAYAAGPSSSTPSKLPSIQSLSGGGGDDFTSMLSASLPAVNEADIETQMRTQYAPQRENLQRRFETKIVQAEQASKQETRALEGAMGTGRRFSSSAQAFMKFVSNENAKKIADLEVQMEDALANFDVQLAGVINQRIQQERQNQQQEFENLFKIINTAMAMEDRNAAKNAGAVKAAREGAIIDQFKNGIQDAASISEKLNFDEAGMQVGDFTIEEITGVLETFKKDRTEIDKLLVDLGKAGATADTIAKVSQANTLADAVMAAGDELQTGTGTVGEYLFYRKEAKALGQTPMTYNEYATMDANRKKTIVNVNQAGLSTTQSSQYLRITDKYQADPVIVNYDKAAAAKSIANQVLANPNDAANQLKSLYSFIKALDPDSVVRESEVSLAAQADSYFGRFNTQLTRIAEGRVISPDVAAQLAQATIDLSDAWQEAANRRTARYVAQANSLDPQIGTAFQGYLDASVELGTTMQSATEIEANAKSRIIRYGNEKPDQQDYVRQLSTDIQPDLGRPYTWQEISQILGLD